VSEVPANEQRVCAQCAYAVLNPFTDRCPRCFTALPPVETHCASCLVQGNCAHARVDSTEPATKRAA
jgi:hypothetical protein